MKPTIGSLFAGIGGIDKGFEDAGFECKWQVEIDDDSTDVLNKNFPHVEKFRDARMFPPRPESPWLSGTWSRQFKVDGIVGGFPCQPHSVGGLRKGKDDERDMWGEFFRIICEIRPSFVLCENVVGILSTDSGRFFGGILRDLSKAGYDAEWHTVSAADFGTPHLRERVFIVAYASGARRKRLVTNKCTSKSAKTPFAVDRHRSAAEWLEMVRHRLPVRNCDGIRAGLVRRCIKQCGNAVVPVVAEHFARYLFDFVTENKNVEV